MDPKTDESRSGKNKKSRRPSISTILGILLFVVGGGIFAWQRINLSREAVTGKVMSGLELEDQITASKGSLEGFNVLVVTFDTTRADHLECYGNRGVETPHLNQLAKDGYLMANCTTVVPATLPSHASMLTGLYPYSHGVRANGSFKLEDQFLTLPEVLKDHGYQNAAFISAYVLDSKFGLKQGFDHYDDDLTKGVKFSSHSFRERAAELTNEPAKKWLTEHAEDPFFCWVHYFDPHANYLPPEPYRSDYAHDLYDGEIAYTDAQLGSLLEHLEELGVRDKTLIVMTADHGEGLGEHDEKTHAMLIYDTTMHVPLIVSAPKALPRSKRIDRQVSIVDVMPTVLDLLGIEIPEDQEGISLLEPPSAEPRVCYIESLSPKTLHGWAPLVGARTKEYKYILAPRSELYHVAEDPGELKNLYQPDSKLVASMHEKLTHFTGDDTSAFTNVAGNLVMSDEDIRRLAGLGYVVTVGENNDQLPASELIDPKDGVKIWEKVQHGLEQFSRGNIEGSITTLEECLEEVPQDVWAMKNLATAYATASNFEEALELLKEAARLEPGDSSLPLHMSKIYERLGDRKMAKQMIQVSQTLDAENPSPYLELAKMAQRDGNDERFIELTDRALEMDHGMLAPSIYTTRGEFHLARGEFDLARQEYELAIKIDELNGPARVGLATVAIQQGHYEDAIKLLSLAMRFNPTFSPTYVKLGVAYEGQQQKKLAEEVYRQGLEFFPRNDTLHEFLGTLLLDLKREDEALDHFRLAVEHNPANTISLVNLGVDHTMKGRIAPAADCFIRALEVDRYNSSAHWSLGRLLLSQGKIDAAISLVARGLELNPKHTDAATMQLILRKYQSEGGKIRSLQPEEKIPAEAYELLPEKRSPDLGENNGA